MPRETAEDVARLLAACPAFTGVDAARLEELAHGAEIVYCSEGADVTDDVARQPLVVQRGALLVLDAHGRSVDLVGAGEFHVADDAERLTAVEAALLVVLPDDAVQLAWSATPEQLRTHVARATPHRVDLQTAPLRSLITADLVTVRGDDTCRTAAQRMRERRISAVVVLGGPEPGILTDRDLRNRLVAEGGSPDDPVSSIATCPVRTIPASCPQFDALVEMLATGIHHLPVTDGGRIIGMLTSGDLLQLQTRDPLHLRKALDRAASVEQLADVLRTLPATASALLVAGTAAGDVARVLATVTDRVVRRLLGIAGGELGEAPAPFGWLAFGSQGRAEQTLSTDQDTGLLLADELDGDAAAWFGDLGSWMTDSLATCGYHRCPGGVMAEREEWRRDGGGWRRRFRQWLSVPTGEHLLGAEIAFDFRTVAGPLDAEPLLRPVVAEAADHGIFLAWLASKVVRHRPPLGFRGRFAVARSGEHAGTFDIKAGALLPITDLGRFHTLVRGGAETGTNERLVAAAADGRLSEDLAATLREGHELALRIRLEHQLARQRDGLPADDRIDPGELRPLVRSQLRETFRGIRAAQEVLATTYETSRLG